jgi:toxin HigB-1
MIESFRSKALQNYWVRKNSSGLRPDWVPKITRILSALHHAKIAEDMDILTYSFHALQGNYKGRYAVTVSRNWRITFAIENGNAIDIDLEDYHG